MENKKIHLENYSVQIFSSYVVYTWMDEKNIVCQRRTDGILRNTVDGELIEISNIYFSFTNLYYPHHNKRMFDTLAFIFNIPVFKTLLKT